ncbi:hypothetical protein K503DRAFT_70982 [Rhizopogon vinicolor AM-OR11-026]|uniref:Aminoacyl-tRNA synthetase class Ia domain-containing protein n=1 Tax=Rhizopogon vinicolor AM-OR11-026 TaxID=1314800 RepID=A0A1B7N446_9AGAM|nr:hypothetical protein K503DRAFT_70982 [Rhizopogon vinicolor AM-OR11-026]
MCLVVGPTARPIRPHLFGLSRHHRFSTCNVSQYSKTLLLPKTSLPLWVDSAKSESLFKRKTCEELCQWQAQNVDGPLFVLLGGPPYANGHLHMRHALNKVLKDIINRYHVLTDHRVR